MLTFACAAVFVLVKVDDHPEVLDVAAVEAALSFCEETDDPQALTGPWEHPIQQDHEKQAQIPHVTVKQERRDCDEPEAKEIQDLISIGELGSEIKTESAELEQNELDSAGAMQIAETPELRSRETEEQQKAAAVVGENSETETESTKGEAATHSTVKIEVHRWGGCVGLVWLKAGNRWQARKSSSNLGVHSFSGDVSSVSTLGAE